MRLPTLPKALWLTLFSIATLFHSTLGFGQILAKNVVTTPEVRAELLAHAPQGLPREPAQAGERPVWLGLRLTHQPHWHTYWQNPGDSGLPTTLEWTLPAGVQAGDIAWPAPQKLPVPPLVNYGYDGTVLLPVPLRFTTDFKPAPGARSVEVRLKASWLACRQECIPQEGEFALALPLDGSLAANGAAFEAALAAVPKDLGVAAPASATLQGDRLVLGVRGLPAALRGQPLSVFPETPEVLDNAAANTPAAAGSWDGEAWRVELPLSKERSASPASMPFVLRAGDTAVRVVARIDGAWPDAAAKAGVSPALEAALRANAASAAATPGVPATRAGGASVGLLAALLGAFVGGLILNLMPCVFPVLAIKVLGFAQHADDRRAHRISGLAYTAGVVVSFVALGALLLALRAAGESLGWGFQLQNPWVVAGLAALFTLIGLNLAGLFEFGSVLPSSVASLHARHPVADAFLTGVLAVAVASPCTAPFMGASLGFAVALPGAQALAVFAAIGFGLALPYLVAALSPAVARALPRPGAWMNTFRHLMAFPMFATVVWLVWVLGQQSGIDGAAALLALLVALAFAIWAFTLATPRTRWSLGLVSLALLAWLAASLGPRVGQLDAPLADAGTPAGASTASGAPQWQPWAPGKVEQLLAAGQPVFVDFTAAWCVTCQYNKKTTLAHADVLADLKAKKVQLLRADWTRRDPAITVELARLGRSGVPVYVLHQPGKPPVVLSELLSVDEVRAALAKL